MSNLVFLLLAVIISVVGVTVLVLRSRPSSSPNSSIDQFHDKMRALAPDDLQGGGTIGRLQQRVAGIAQQRQEELAIERPVVDDEDFCHRYENLSALQGPKRRYVSHE